MKIVILVIFALMLPSLSFAETPRSYADARASWESSRNTAEYKSYAAEFSQFNNRFHLDEKGGC